MATNQKGEQVRGIRWNPEIVSLTSTTARKYLQNRQQMVLVMFYSDTHEKCKAFAPEWNTAPKRVGGLMEIGKVDAAKDKVLAAEFGVTSLPAFRLFTYDINLQPAAYEGGLEMEDIVEWAISYLPASQIRILVPHQWVGFASQAGAKVVLFTEKSAPTPIYRALSMKFKNRIHFGMIRKTETSLVEELKCTKFPSLLIVTTDGKQFFYHGDMQLEALQKLVAKYASKWALPTTQVTKREVLDISYGNWERVCGNQLCMIMLVSSRKNLEGAKAALMEVATKYKSATMGFGVMLRSDATGEDKFTVGKQLAKLLPVDGVLLVKQHRKRQTALPLTEEHGVYPTDVMTVFLSSALSGDITWHPL